MNDKNPIEHTYGEIKLSSLSFILSKFDLNDKSFLDIGSGYGNTIIFVAKYYPVKKATGIEILKSRYKISKNKITTLPTKIKDKIRFQNKNILLFKKLNYDIIFFNNICFPNKKFTNLHYVFKKTDSILICFKKIQVLEKFFHSSISNIGTTWSNDTNVYIYKIYKQ